MFFQDNLSFACTNLAINFSLSLRQFLFILKLTHSIRFTFTIKGKDILSDKKNQKQLTCCRILYSKSEICAFSQLHLDWKNNIFLACKQQIWAKVLFGLT